MEPSTRSPIRTHRQLTWLLDTPAASMAWTKSSADLAQQG